MRVSPTTCWRPSPALMADWAGPQVSAAPAARAADLLRDAAARGILVRDDLPAYYVCRLATPTATALAVMGAIGLDELSGPAGDEDCAGGMPWGDADVAGRLAHLSATQAQTRPIVLSHPDEPALSTLVALATTGDPLYELGDAAARLTMWRVVRPVAVESLTVLYGRLGQARIVGAADVAAASLALRDRRRREGTLAGTEDQALCMLLCAADLAATDALALADGVILRRV